MPYKDPAAAKACRIRNNAHKLEYMRKYRLANRDQENARCAKWYKENKARALEQQTAYNKAHPEVNKAATKKYRDKMRQDPKWLAEKCAETKARNAANPELARANHRRYATAEYRRRYGTDPNYTLRRKLRCAVVKRLKQQNAKKTASTFDLIGCSIDELKLHLQAQFKPRMNWNNYGYRGWHIDHKIALSHFDLLDPEQQRIAFHFSNLQPLWAAENLSKSDKL